MKKTLLLKAVLAAVVLGYLVYFIDADEIVRAARSADGRFIAGAAALLPAVLLIETVVWRRLVRTVAPGVRFGAAVGALLCGYSLGVFTPARAGEFAGRAFYLRYDDKWTLSALVFLQRMLDMTIAITLGTGAMAWFAWGVGGDYASAWKGLTGVGAGLGGGLLFLALRPRLTHRLLQRALRKPKLRTRTDFLRELDTRAMLGLVGLATLRYGIQVTQFSLLVLAFADASPTMLPVGVGLVLFAKFLVPSITLTDLGIREGAAVFFLGALGVAQAAAFNGSLLVFAINLVLPAILGLPFVLRLRLSRREREAEPPPTSPAPAHVEGR